MIYNKQLKQWEWSSLKSKNSYRKIPLTKRALSIIDKQPKSTSTSFIFGDISFTNPNNVQKYISKIYGTHAHAFRHTCASNLIAYSYDVLGYCDKDLIAQFMGHDVKELERTYKHLFRDKKDELLKVLEFVNDVKR